MRRYLKHRYNSPFTCSIPVPPREAFVQYVEVKIHDAVATILMERPKTCNALHPQLLEELSLAFSDVHQEKKVQAVILSGSGSHFCSGLDFNTLRAISELETSEAMPQWFKIWERLSEVYETMLRFPKPIVAAVDGGGHWCWLRFNPSIRHHCLLTNRLLFSTSDPIRVGGGFNRCSLGLSFWVTSCCRSSLNLQTARCG